MRLAILLLVLGLSGCSVQGQLIHESAVNKAEDAIDAANQLALRQLCKNMTRGSYNRLCQGNNDMCQFLDGMCAMWQGSFKNWTNQAEIREKKAAWRERGYGPLLLNGQWK